MGLNNRAQKSTSNSGGGNFIFKEGAKHRYMSGKDPIVFRFLPDFEPSNQDTANSFRAHITPEGALTNWGNIVYLARFIGHGRGGAGGTRRDFVSLTSFGEDDEDVYCPIMHLWNAIRNDAGDWGYLMEDDEVTKDRAAFKKPAEHFVANVIDLNKPMDGVVVGCFSKSASNSLINGKEGLVYQRNNLPAEVLQQNYLLAYAVGDMTNPTTGPAMMLAKKQDKGDYSGYAVTLATTQNGELIQRAISQQEMTARHYMGDPSTFLNVPTEEELVMGLASVLSGRSPKGYHEHSLLQMAFPNVGIPDPPQAPGASNTMQGGVPPAQGNFGGSPVQQAQGVQGGGQQFTPPAGAPVQQQQTPVQQPVQQAPVQQAPVQQQQTAVQQPPVQQGAPVQQAPVAQAPVAQAPAAEASGGEVAGVQQNIQQAAVAEPTTPGDVTPPTDFDPKAYMKQLEDKAQG